MDTASPNAILSSFPLSRAAATGAPHARLRNIDRGPGDHQHISRLSAALRRRLISEDEIVSAVLDQQGLSPATALGCRQVVTRFVPVGPIADRPALLRAATAGEAS